MCCKPRRSIRNGKKSLTASVNRRSKNTWWGRWRSIVRSGHRSMGRTRGTCAGRPRSTRRRCLRMLRNNKRISWDGWRKKKRKTGVTRLRPPPRAPSAKGESETLSESPKVMHSLWFDASLLLSHDPPVNINYGRGENCIWNQRYERTSRIITIPI